MSRTRKALKNYWASPIVYIENYLASEGFIAYKNRQHAQGMHLILNNNIFMEFVPFDDKNFDSDGNIVEKPQALLIQDVQEDKEYAILLSTNSGAWRYLIGDTIRFINKQKSEIRITGRTKHFLSLVGEHLSVENMNSAVEMASEELNISIPEYTVAGLPYNGFFAHQWYVACDDGVDETVLRNKIDEKLRQLNDDYAVERDSALKEVFLQKLPEQKFMHFLEQKGKIGGQHKFPRVMKGKMLEDWMKYLSTGSV